MHSASIGHSARLELALRYVLLPGHHVPAGVVVVLRVLQHVRADRAEVRPPLDGVVRVAILRVHQLCSLIADVRCNAKPSMPVMYMRGDVPSCPWQLRTVSL